MKTVAFIPLRGGSKSIPLKNIKPLWGKPLCFWVISQACKCDFIEKVFVSTDNEEIKKCVEGFNFEKVKVISRSAETATDNATSESALLEFCQNYDFEYVYFIQATSPFLKAENLNKANEIFNKHKPNSMLSVVRKKQFLWNIDGTPMNYDPQKRPRRQDWQGYFVENGAFYFSSKNAILQSQCRISGKIIPVETDEKSLFEIDEPSDFELIEKISII